MTEDDPTQRAPIVVGGTPRRFRRRTGLARQLLELGQRLWAEGRDQDATLCRDAARALRGGGDRG